MKRQCPEWENVFASHILMRDQYPIYIYEEPLQLNSKIKSDLKMGRGYEYIFFPKKTYTWPIGA